MYRHLKMSVLKIVMVSSVIYKTFMQHMTMHETFMQHTVKHKTFMSIIYIYNYEHCLLYACFWGVALTDICEDNSGPIHALNVSMDKPGMNPFVLRVHPFIRAEPFVLGDDKEETGIPVHQ